VGHLPEDAAVWRMYNPRSALASADVLASIIERWITALWATVAVALGQDVTDAQLADPLDAWASPAAAGNRQQVQG
jgi:hypothetical protein